MLVAQARLEGLTVATADPLIDAYAVVVVLPAADRPGAVRQ